MSGFCYLTRQKRRLTVLAGRRILGKTDELEASLAFIRKSWRDMKFDGLVNEKAWLAEVGERVARLRIDLGLSQAALAEQAGIGKRTLERLESGHSVQLSNFLRVLRVLGRLEGLEGLLPEGGPRPMDLLKLRGRERQRASPKRVSDEPNEDWHWGDEP